MTGVDGRGETIGHGKFSKCSKFSMQPKNYFSEKFFDESNVAVDELLYFLVYYLYII